MRIKNFLPDLLLMKKGPLKLITLLVTFFYGSADMFAQSAEGSGMQSYVDWMIFVYIFLTILAFFAVSFFGSKEEKPFIAGEHVPLWTRLKDYFVAATPIEKEHEILMDDDYDGIKELDNRIPPWFNYLFYTTVIFAVIYLLNYQVLKTGKNQYQEYDEEIRAAAVQKAELLSSGSMVSENTVTRLTDPEALDAGKTIFKANCTPCHGEGGGGIVGPNLTDKYWIHGGGIKNIFTTISNGVPAKGMPTWSSKFNPKQIQEVASYVMSLQGTHPANAKPPEGNLYEGN